MSVCNHLLTYQNKFSEVKIHSLLSGKKIPNSQKMSFFTYIAYFFWGQSRIGYLGAKERNLQEKYSLRIKRNSLYPKFVLYLLGWTKVKYQERSLWVNKNSLKRKARIFSPERENLHLKTNQEIFTLFIQKTQKFQTIHNNALYLQSKLHKISRYNFTLDKTTAIAKTCFFHSGKQMQLVHDIPIFSKNVIIVPKKNIGSGAFKEVQSCVKLYLNSGKEKNAALIKISDKENIEGAKKEAATLQRFSICKQIADPYDYFGVFKKVFYGVTTLYDGDLSEKKSARNPSGKNSGVRQDLSHLDKLQIAVDIAKGIGEMDKEKYLHLDLKLENIFLLPKKGLGPRRAVIGDLGLAGKKGTKGLFAGTLLYQPPEILTAYCPPKGVPKAKEEEILPLLEKADIWSVGLILCNLFCPDAFLDWEKKADKVHPPDFINALLAEVGLFEVSPEDIANLKIDESKIEKYAINPDLKEIIKKCLQLDPNARCSIEQVNTVLSKVLKSANSSI